VGRKHRTSISMLCPARRGVIGVSVRLNSRHSIAPDVKGVHHTMQVGMLSVESEFRFPPANLPKPRNSFVQICRSRIAERLKLPIHLGSIAVF
jgi:hypothetical protein